MESDATLYLTKSNKGVPYYSLQFEDYELPLFGSSFALDSLQLPIMGNVCSERMYGTGWEIVGTFEKQRENIKIFLNQIGYFLAEPTESNGVFVVKKLPPPIEPLKLIGFNTKMQTPIPKNSKMYHFITKS